MVDDEAAIARKVDQTETRRVFDGAIGEADRSSLVVPGCRSISLKKLLWNQREHD